MKIFRPAHEEPKKLWLGYILLPYGEFYHKTKDFLKAKPGDILRFYNGTDVVIKRVWLIPCDEMCEFLCQMRYGISWEKAFSRWLSYARLEGNGKDVFSTSQCLLVIYDLPHLE